MPSYEQQGAGHGPNTKMSLEDLHSDFQSDESDYETEMNFSDGDDEHVNNSYEMTDMQCVESEAEPSFDSGSIASELALIQDYIDSMLEDASPTNSSTSSPGSSHEDGSSNASDDSALSCVQDLVYQLYEEVISTYSPSPSDASDVAHGQMTNGNDTNHLQDGADGAEGQL